MRRRRRFNEFPEIPAATRTHEGATMEFYYRWVWERDPEVLGGKVCIRKLLLRCTHGITAIIDNEHVGFEYRLICFRCGGAVPVRKSVPFEEYIKHQQEE